MPARTRVSIAISKREANARPRRQGEETMNDQGAAPVSAGSISARIDRLPATRTIWTIVVLLGFGMFFELYDLLFSAYVAPSLVKSGVLTATTAGLFGTTGVASFIAALFTGLFIGTILCGFLADRLRPPGDLHLVASLVLRGQHHGGAAERRRRPQSLALRVRRRAWRRDGDHRRLFERARAEGDPRPRLRGQPGDRLRLRAGHLVPRLASGANARRSGSRAGAGWC